MGFIASSSTVTASAYITELGRQYLFGNSLKPRFATDANGNKIDRFEPVTFSLGDPDSNYKNPLQLSAGTIPDVSGASEDTIKGAKGRDLVNIITPKDASFEQDITTLEYKPSTPTVSIDFSKNLSTIPTIYTIQLITFINGQNIQDGLYTVTPTNYGATQMKNGELTIILRDATPTQAGYRMRIFFPESGSNYNKITIQFEQGLYATGTITETHTKTFNSTGAGLALFGGVNLQNITVE